MAETKNILLRLDPELADQLSTIATVEGKAVSEVIRDAIRDLVASRRTDKDFQRQLRSEARRQQQLLDQLRGGRR